MFFKAACGFARRFSSRHYDVEAMDKALEDVEISRDAGFAKVLDIGFRLGQEGLGRAAEGVAGREVAVIGFPRRGGVLGDIVGSIGVAKVELPRYMVLDRVPSGAEVVGGGFGVAIVEHRVDRELGADLYRTAVGNYSGEHIIMESLVNYV